ncbi:hypothetical protein NQ315_009558 [Exocentrus adspersus]|uniref:Kringle domain-containing protein n=1 Tax=Exocentrus adspersus TaxID=1586481 RepID=A0AAV8WGY2_9CUCU|nr:hypothetical protein NQ315_009558 [Exocentrus adspersus]
MIAHVLQVLIYITFVVNEAPPGNLTDFDKCKLSHLGLEYHGTVSKSESGVRCQSWSSDQPHKIRENIKDITFTDGSKKNAKNYCRNPTKDPSGPWCYTMNHDLQFESCALSLCSVSLCKVTGPGMEFAGSHNRGSSDRKCLKWNKDRNRVKQDGGYVKISKFDKQYFPENHVGDAKKHCRNPNGDIGGPWCFVENEDTGDIEKEYCDIPFCDDPDCLVFTKNFNRYMHYTDFNGSLSNFTFGIKLWDSDSYLDASARLVLSVMPLPLTGKEIDDVGVGLEILIGNNFTALRYGNKDKPEYEPTRGVLKSSEFTMFHISWHAGFITFGLEGQIKPIFLAEYKTKNNLLGFKKNVFLYYAAQGTNILWYFPFCKDDFECDVQTTTGVEFQQFWPLREKSLGRDMHFHVRAYHSAGILFTPSPTIDYPYVKIVLLGHNNYTKVTAKEHVGGPEIVIKELQLPTIVNYWEWREFSVTFFANSMYIYVKKPAGMQTLVTATSEVFRSMRWFSVNSENTVAQWSFFCIPPLYSNPPPALLPECALNKEEPNYKGTQDITSEGLPCLPWSGQKLIGEDLDHLFSNESSLEAWNYCRDPYGNNEGTYCYTISLIPETKIEKNFCNLRKCKSEQCRMAGTGNDYIGSLTVTRSNRTCDSWIFSNISLHARYKQLWNNSLFADLSAEAANTFCRNPSRDISGCWCFTSDPQVVEDSCNVRDCDKPEECIIIVSAFTADRKMYILPQWKETGVHGGLRFAIKEWNPDLLDGLNILLTPQFGLDVIKIQIGANNNEKIVLYYNDELVETKTFPHIISAGKWTELWLQIRKGEVVLGFEGVPTAIFEWKSNDPDKSFEPMFLSYGSILGHPLGLFFKCSECHTENTTVKNSKAYHPIGLWSTEELPFYNNFTLTMRGVGVTLVQLASVVGYNNQYLLKMDSGKGTITLSNIVNGFSHLMSTSKVENVLTNSWTKYTISFNESAFSIQKENETILQYKSTKPIIIYWFTVSTESGWVTWSANCEPLDLDGPPRDGGWSGWSPWTCTVTCGGGEGFRTRKCSNPHPNIFGKLCQGSSTSTGKCNDFPCGDISPQTLDRIRDHLQNRNYSYVIDEGASQVLKNDRDLLKLIAKESPNAYYEWTLNGIFIQRIPNHFTFQGDDILIENADVNDAGVYVCMLFRINKKKVVFRALSLAVISKNYDYNTRATRSFILNCNAVILAYIYSDLSLTLYLNNEVYIDHGTTTLAAVNIFNFDSLNMSHTGDWRCLVQQKDLKLSWVTNYIKLNVKKAPNIYTNLMEDKLTAPLFAWLKTDRNVLIALIFIVASVIVLVVLFLVLYFKFCTLKARNIAGK